MKLFEVECACGRRFGSKVIKQHRRTCVVQLETWQREGRPVYLLDCRTPDAKAKHPIPDLDAEVSDG